MKCEKCNVGDMVERDGKHGKFLACNNYPNCKNTKTVPKVEVNTETRTSGGLEINVPAPKPTKTYELTDGSIRIGALRCAVERQKDSNEFNWELVKRFEEYIRNGK